MGLLKSTAAGYWHEEPRSESPAKANKHHVTSSSVETTQISVATGASMVADRKDIGERKHPLPFPLFERVVYSPFPLFYSLF